MEDLAALSDDELRAEMRQVEAELEDLEDVRFATLGQTGVHLGAGKLAALKRSWAREESRLQDRRAAIQAIMQTG